MPKAFAKKIEIQNKIKIKAAVSSINDLNLQKKAFMSLVASKVLSDYLKENQITIVSENNSLSGLLLLKDFDIANITVENNIKIAVRAFVGDDYPQMCIPRSHFLNNILADIYVGVRLETTLENAEFVGFIEVDQINRQAGNDKYVSVDVNHLKSIDTINQAINSSSRRKNSHLALDHEKARELFFQYIESRIASSDKEFLARHISSCTQCSEEFNHIIELDNMIKAVGHKFNFEENNNEDYTLRLFAGDPSLVGQEVEINIEEENINNIDSSEKNINQATSRQKKKKHISGRRIGRVISATGKLALLSGAVLGGGQLVSALQVANISGLVGSAAFAMAASSAKGISESLSSVSEHFNEMALSGGNGSINHDDEKFNNHDMSFGELDNSNNFDSHEANLLDNEVAGNFELNSEEENIQDFDSHEANLLDNEVAGNFELNSEEENIQDFDSHEEANLLDNEVAGNFELNSEEENIKDFDSHEETNLLDNEVASNFELNSEEENIKDFDSHEETNLLDNEVAGNFELNSEEENIQDFDSHEEVNLLNNEIPGNVDLTGEMLAEVEPLVELNELVPNEHISEEIKENLPDMQSSSIDLSTSITEESILENNNEESISGDEQEVASLHQETQEVPHKNYSEETFLPEKEKDLDNAFDDIAIEYNIDDILSSFDNVEVVDSTNDFFDFDNSENVSTQDDIKSDKEQTADLIGEIYDDQKEVAAEHKVSPASKKSQEKSYDFDDDFDDEEEQDQTALRKEKMRSLDLKVASGLVAAGIAVTVAVALWINNKTLTNQNLPFVNPQPVNQMGVLPNPDPTGTNNQNSNIAMPPANPSGQSTPDRTKKPLHSGTKQVKPKDIPPPSKDLSAVLAEAFTRRTYEVDIRNISWEITADMARNPVFKNYIMVTGQALKSALARDLSLANDRALTTQMEIKTVMDLNGNILEANVVQSSGSQEVDKICLETYKTTIQFTKLPKINVNRDKIKANLIISF